MPNIMGEPVWGDLLRKALKTKVGATYVVVEKDDEPLRYIGNDLREAVRKAEGCAGYVIEARLLYRAKGFK